MSREKELSQIAATPGEKARRSLLELAPLELACMNVLWGLHEATVRDIRDGLAPSRPRAYTTIMTIMDRLARKGVVARRKVGRAYRYSAYLSEEDARSHALGEVIENFFRGSIEALITDLRAHAIHNRHAGRRRQEADAGSVVLATEPPEESYRPRVRAAAAGAIIKQPAPVAHEPISSAAIQEETPTARLDDTLL
jgi:BlaI family transcriptional regulator, penicillinase repressor